MIHLISTIQSTIREASNENLIIVKWRISYLLMKDSLFTNEGLVIY